MASAYTNAHISKAAAKQQQSSARIGEALALVFLTAQIHLLAADDLAYVLHHKFTRYYSLVQSSK